MPRRSRLWRASDLGVGVDGHQIDALRAFFDHAVNGVAPAAAYADYLDLGETRLFLGTTLAT
jgi:hypothetical protein